MVLFKYGLYIYIFLFQKQKTNERVLTFHEHFWRIRLSRVLLKETGFSNFCWVMQGRLWSNAFLHQVTRECFDFWDYSNLGNNRLGLATRASDGKTGSNKSSNKTNNKKAFEKTSNNFFRVEGTSIFFICCLFG